MGLGASERGPALSPSPSGSVPTGAASERASRQTTLLNKDRKKMHRQPFPRVTAWNPHSRVLTHASGKLSTHSLTLFNTKSSLLQVLRTHFAEMQWQAEPGSQGRQRAAEALGTASAPAGVPACLLPKFPHTRTPIGGGKGLFPPRFLLCSLPFPKRGSDTAVQSTQTGLQGNLESSGPRGVASASRPLRVTSGCLVAAGV